MTNKTRALLLFSVGLLSACGIKEKTDDVAESYPVVTIEAIDTSLYNDYVTEIHAIQNIEIRARVAGYLEKIFIDEGAHVREGQVLFSINNREYIEELAKAKAIYRSTVADVAAAELEYKNVLQLQEKSIVSPTEVALAKNKLEAQKAKMEEALAHQAYVQIKLSNTEIKAPFSGIINRIPHKIGSLIDEGTLLTSLSEYHEVYAYFDVSEKEYLNYAKNLKSDSVESKVVSLVLADGTEHGFKGKIETVEGVIDESTGNIAFRAKFPNPEKLIRHGASGLVRLRKKFGRVLVVPQKSTFEVQDKIYVYVVDATNKISVRNITTNARLPHLYIVAQGLKAGEQIVYEGIQNLQSDLTIVPEKRSLKQVIKELSAK
jgi:membrane fusion protein (multidrug efflux system)